MKQKVKELRDYRFEPIPDLTFDDLPIADSPIIEFDQIPVYPFSTFSNASFLSPEQRLESKQLVPAANQIHISMDVKYEPVTCHLDSSVTLLVPLYLGSSCS